MAVVNSRCLRAHKLAVKGGTTVTPDMETDVITYKEALWLATMGGAKALDLEERVGSFEVRCKGRMRWLVHDEGDRRCRIDMMLVHDDIYIYR
jgi:cytosine/adenosine deaminase-related metal-dependent hydrolase